MYSTDLDFKQFADVSIEYYDAWFQNVHYLKMAGVQNFILRKFAYNVKN